MAEEQPSLHIDTDWKKQAQEEKRRLAEQEQKKAAAAPAAKVADPAQEPSRTGRPGRPRDAAAKFRGSGEQPRHAKPLLSWRSCPAGQ